MAGSRAHRRNDEQRTYLASPHALQPPSLSTNATYFVIASSLLVPFFLVHASNLARPFMSSMPGREPLTSPVVACL